MFDPDGCVTPGVAHGGAYLKQYLKHEGGIVEYSMIADSFSIPEEPLLDAGAPVSNTNTLFYAMLALNTIAWIFFTSVRCYVDGLVTNVVNTVTPKRSYGTQRVCSTFGYALITFLSGVMCDHYHPSGMSGYTAAFYVYLPCIIGVIPCGLKLLGQSKFGETVTDDQKDTSGEGERKNNILALFRVFKDIDFVVFFISVIICGLTLNIFNCFSFLLMDKELKSNKTLMTFTIVVSCVFEVAVFWFSKQIIRICRGTIPALCIGIFSFCPRFIFMSYIRNPWLVLISQPLHGLGMGLAWAACIDHTYASFPAEVGVTAIALMSSINFIGSTAIANMAGGLLYDLYGGRWLFRWSGVVAGVWCVVMALYFGVRYRQKMTKMNSQVNENKLPVPGQGVGNEAYEL